MQQIELELAGGGVLTVSLRASLDAMPAVKQRPLVLVVPGGGYDHVSPREGDPVALQFAAAGYHTAVLTYSVGEGAQNYQPLRQLNEALALLRQNAGEWHILPDKIAVCGFSAGGHLALSAAVLDIPGETAQQRPNAVILGYPVVTAGEFAHRGSFVQLAGSEAESFYLAVLVCFNPLRCVKFHDLYAFSHGTFNLFRKSCHISFAASVGNCHLVCAQADRRTGYVHGYVAAADNTDLLAAKIWIFAVTDGTEKFDSGDNTAGIFSLNTNLFITMSADGDVDSIIFFAEFFQRQLSRLIAD